VREDPDQVRVTLGEVSENQVVAAHDEPVDRVDRG